MGWRKVFVYALIFLSCKTTSKPVPVPRVTAVLDGSKSVGDFYYWRQISGTTVTINGVNKVKPTVTFYKKGVYQFELMVSVKNVVEHPLDTVKITVR